METRHKGIRSGKLLGLYADCTIAGNTAKYDTPEPGESTPKLQEPVNLKPSTLKKFIKYLLDK